jgi:hypothetical protein
MAEITSSGRVAERHDGLAQETGLAPQCDVQLIQEKKVGGFNAKPSIV